ncbi:MAG: RNA polymerase factor sigma-32 [Myxococcota bacterium]|nr:RNA polymerase factor sigma-32 [Myxococcota bacterium]
MPQRRSPPAGTSAPPAATYDAPPATEENDEADLELVEPDLEPVADAAEAPPPLEPTALARLERSDLDRHDPLAAYMRDVSRYPLLSPEQEHELAVRYATTGDLNAARRLVTSNLRLVVKIAHDYRRAYRNLLDLVQEGNIGLMQAVRKFDPFKGVKLSSYAAWWIRAYILRFILNNHRLVKLGTTQAQRKLFFNLRKEKARLEAMGIDPTAERIAERLSVSVEDVEQMDRRLSDGEASLDAPLALGEGRSIARVDALAAGGAPIDERLADEQLDELLTAKIHAFGATLSGKDAIIFRERLLADDPRTLQDIGEQLGVSRERVRQLEKRLLGKLRAYLAAELGESVLDAYRA